MDFDDRQLGTLAYEAYCQETHWKSAISGVVLPPFDETPESVQRAWIAAARALKQALRQ